MTVETQETSICSSSTSAPMDIDVAASSMNAWINDLVTPIHDSIETEISWHKSQTPESLVQKLLSSNHNIPSIIDFFNTKSPPKYQSYGYTSLLHFQTIGMTRLSSILMRMNHSSTSLVLSQIVQIHLPTTNHDPTIPQVQPQPQPMEIQYLLSILLYALQPMAGLTSASATIWRSICDISQRYPHYAHEIHIINDARNCLAQQVIEPGMESCCSNVSSSSSSFNGKKMAKLLKFFLCRLESLMALDGCLDVNEKKDDTIMVHHDDDQVKNVITHLLLWRGQVEFSPWVDIQELGSKINVCLEKWILYKKSKDSNLNHYEMLDEWRLQHVLKWSPSNQKSILLYSYGKWIFLIHVMETLVRSYTKQERVDRKEWDDMLSIVESLLFCIIPKCHELVTTAGSHLVMTQTLDSVSDVLLLLERCPVVSSPTPQSSSATEHSCLFRELHKHLLKWLAQCHPPSPGEQSMIVVHPLTYELVQTAVYLHVIRSFSCNHIEKYCFISHMMKLCSKLLFSDRTHKTLRSNISALTFRILSNGALPSLRTLCESFVILEGQNFVMNLQIQSFGKRKRNDDQIQRWKTLDGYVDLLPVFSKVLNNLFWTRLGDAKCETLMRDIEEVLLLEENEEVQCNRFRLLSKQAPTLLSLLSALLLNAPFVKQMKKEQTVRGILYSIAFMNDNCKDTIALFRQLSRIIDQKLVNHNKMVPWIQNVFQSISKKSTTSQKFGMCIVLPSLGVIVNNSAADGFIKTIQGSFASLIGEKDYSISATAMSSMELFGSSLSSSYRQIIPHCVPLSHQFYLQTRIKGGDHIYSLSSKTILKINPDDIREWRRQESKRLDSFVKRFDSEGPISLLSLYKNFHVYEISDGSGKSVILFAPPNDNPFDLGVFSKWHISRSGKLSSWVTRPDGTFKILMK